MKKIFTSDERLPAVNKGCVFYSEQYIVKASYKTVNNITCTHRKSYYSCSKNAHKAVQARHRKLFPFDYNISSTYQ